LFRIRLGKQEEEFLLPRWAAYILMPVAIEEEASKLLLARLLDLRLLKAS
jgi:hypothetical protein